MSSVVTVTIECDNSAFRDPTDDVEDTLTPAHESAMADEVARILEGAARKLRERGIEDVVLHDGNGNRVGGVTVALDMPRGVPEHGRAPGM